MVSSSVKLISNYLPKLKKQLKFLSKNEVLVGVPKEENKRRDEPTEMTNAALAYIHDNGSPAANIPARPFMIPGIERAKGELIKQFGNGIKSILKGKGTTDESTLHAVGLIAQASIRNVINEGIPPPLKEGTLKGRIRKRTSIKGALVELKHRKAGSEATLTNAKPLVATGQLRNSINYVIRNR